MKIKGKNIARLFPLTSLEFLVNKDFSIGESAFKIKMADLFFIIKNKDKKIGIFFVWKNNIPKKITFEIE